MQCVEHRHGYSCSSANSLHKSIPLCHLQGLLSLKKVMVFTFCTPPELQVALALLKAESGLPLLKSKRNNFGPKIKIRTAKAVRMTNKDAQLHCGFLG